MITRRLPRHCQRARQRARGSAYVMVLGVSVLVAVIGFGTLLTARVATRASSGANDAAEADALATSAVEQGLALINSQSDWRTRYSGGADGAPQKLGRGTLSWRVVDEYDGNLSDDPGQPARLYGTGAVGSARRVYSVLLQPTGAALEVLKKAAHGDAAFTVRASVATVQAVGGPLSTDGVFDCGSGTINADVEADNISGGGIIGSKRDKMNNRPMPSGGAADLYAFRATSLAWERVSPGLSGALGPGVNPYGAANREGIYKVHVPAYGQLKVDNARLMATLLVTVDPGARVTIGPSVLWEPPRSYLPSLIVRGADVKVTFDSAAAGVVEATAGQSLNPPGMPYNGSTDLDALDTYPSELRGLFHVAGKGSEACIGPNMHMSGVLLTDGTITVGDALLKTAVNASLAADPRLYSDPPAGYTGGERMVPVEGTWERRPSP